MRTENGRRFKRGLFSGDYHSGHYVGLTPPKYWSDDDKKWGQTQRACWNFFSDRLNFYKPLDLVQANGDLIAGKNKKSGSRQLLKTSMEEQCELARDVLLFTECDLIRITRGTAYHVTADGEQWENVIARMLREGNDKINVKVNNHGYYNFNGKNFDVKHKIGGSTIPHGRLTAIAKEILWAQMWCLQNGNPYPDVLIRSHTHFTEQIFHDGCHGIILPGMQGLGDEYGELDCSGTVFFGFYIIDVFDDGAIRIIPEIMRGELQRSLPELL
jgi:hypothetical protein